MKLTPKIQLAIDVAARAHKNQVRKDGKTPYITHPFSVALILSNYTDNEDLLAAAILHDVLEDAADLYSEVQMRKDFGKQVTEIVLGVTEDKSISDWQARKDAYLERLKEDPTESVMLSCADLIHNLYSTVSDTKKFGPEFLTKFASDNISRSKTYDIRCRIIADRLDNLIVDELQHAFDSYKKLISEVDKK